MSVCVCVHCIASYVKHIKQEMKRGMQVVWGKQRKPGNVFASTIISQLYFITTQLFSLGQSTSLLLKYMI